jgi:hypothetical protein
MPNELKVNYPIPETLETVGMQRTPNQNTLSQHLMMKT